MNVTLVSLVIFSFLFGILALLAIWNVYRGLRGIQTNLFDLQLKYGTPVSKRCCVCGTEVWLGYDGYDYEGQTFCKKHKSPQLEGYYKI